MPLTGRKLRMYTSSHLWDDWFMYHAEGNVLTLHVDEPHQVMIYAPIRKVYKNKAVMAVVFRQADGNENVILLDPEREVSGSFVSSSQEL